MKRKNSWILLVLIIVIFISIPVFHVLKTKWNEDDHHSEIPYGYTNDASQLNLTKVDTIIQVPENKEEIKQFERNAY
ncbi:hypothetical protein LZQ00_05315 [Sphingobacterium sp. SRCM116780]|uniref:hypothetical protein n=1 Tax=Sphingobacterium sp. SRCM116780 TaxID=2907623 RepID=UPI001F3C5459|nr:hypothetical protein [Sphingobacterium sp. SRCM116780]UIR57233.1 hypothetical protein LZQ00_05315 [Sphingobacterium sp. SRCM116780]